jgi:predicted lysophospholipase L1 biosynthesis ABC-type transport system permease subunit
LRRRVGRLGPYLLWKHILLGAVMARIGVSLNWAHHTNAENDPIAVLKCRSIRSLRLESLFRDYLVPTDVISAFVQSSSAS